MNIPKLRVEVAFGAATTGTYLHLDDTKRGRLGTGTLGPAGGVWTDVSAYVQGCTITRGADRTPGAVQRPAAGTATLTLNNSDRRFDPTNLAGPYVSAGVTQVTPMRAVRIWAVWADVTYPLFRGSVDGWAIDYNGPNYSRAVVPCTDGTKILESYDRAQSAPAGAGELSGARVNRVLDSVNWPAADRVIDAGMSTVQATTLAGSARAELELVAQTEIGEVYLDGSGRVVFRDRHAILTDARSATSQGLFGDGGGPELQYSDVTVEYDDKTLTNYVRVTRAGGAEQAAVDPVSVGTYLTSSYERSGLLLETDSEALEYARYVLHLGKDPELRFAQLVLHPEEPAKPLLYPHMLSREYGDRITIRRRPPGGGALIERDVFIRGISHEVGQSWRTTWSLQSATRYSFFTLDHSTSGRLSAGNALGY